MAIRRRPPRSSLEWPDDLSAPDAQLSRDGTSGETSPPDVPARSGSHSREGRQDRATALPDRRKHKQRVARPRSLTTAPRVLPGHFGAGPPPQGRAYEHYEGGLHPSRLAPCSLNGPGTAPLRP